MRCSKHCSGRWKKSNVNISVIWTPMAPIRSNGAWSNGSFWIFTRLWSMNKTSVGFWAFMSNPKKVSPAIIWTDLPVTYIRLSVISMKINYCLTPMTHITPIPRRPCWMPCRNLSAMCGRRSIKGWISRSSRYFWIKTIVHGGVNVFVRNTVRRWISRVSMVLPILFPIQRLISAGFPIWDSWSWSVFRNPETSNVLSSLRVRCYRWR